MRKRYKIFLISFIAILSCTFVRAQQHYTITNGLSSNTVYNSFRDSKGYIWFGTDKGVCRFDGKNFKTFTATDGLTDNSVIDFFEDASGRLWLFLVNGGNSFIYQDQVYNATNNRLLSKMPAIAFPRAMCSGKDSSIYIASNSGKIFKIKDTTFTTIINSYPNPFCAVKFDKDTLYACNQMLGMFKVHNDRLVQLQQYHYNLAYLADTNLILVFPGYLAVYRSGRIDTVYKDPSIQLANTVQIVAHDKNSFFYCTHNGLLLIHLTRHTQTWILQDMDVTSICKDIAGNYWVTTLSDGIYQLQSELSNVTFISNISNDKLIQRNDHLYRTTKDSLYIFDEFTLKQHPLKARYSNYWHVLADDDNYFIYSALTYTALIDKQTGKAYNNMFGHVSNSKIAGAHNMCIPYDHNSFLLASTSVFSNVKITGKKIHTAFIKNLNYKILKIRKQDANKKAYILTNANLHQFSIPDNKETTIDSFTGEAPIDLFCFNNHIAVTTAKELIIYTLGSNRKLVYRLNGLGISDMKQINTDRFIIATNKGYRLLNFSEKHISIEAITYPFNGSDIYEVYNCGNNLLMNVSNNLYKVDAALINSYKIRPTFFIKKIAVNNITDTSRHIILNNTGGNNIFISLSPLYFGNPNISYKYRFIKDHNNSQWFYSDGGEFNLSLPSYGDYKIEFAAVADNNNTSASQFLYVSWPPPFYLTWWFFTIIGLLFVALIVYMVYLNNQRRKLKFEKEMDQLQLEHKAINSLLNPHFVFNAINNIQNLVNKYRVDDANEYLARLSRLIRQNIENLQFNLITADKELSLIRNYIYLQNLRFNDKIHLQINNTADADKLCLPPLLIHTFVENSVVHGFSPDIKDFTITIDIHPDGKDYVAINITDNGLGLNKPTQAQQVLKDKTSIGVDATRRRLQKLSEFYKVQYKLDITDRQATEGTSGARVSIRFYAHFGNLLPVN